MFFTRRIERCAEELANVQRFRGGLVFKAHRLVYHSTLGLIVIKKKRGLASRPENNTEEEE